MAQKQKQILKNVPYKYNQVCRAVTINISRDRSVSGRPFERVAFFFFFF